MPDPLAVSLHLVPLAVTIGPAVDAIAEPATTEQLAGRATAGIALLVPVRPGGRLRVVRPVRVQNHTFGITIERTGTTSAYLGIVGR